MERSQQELILTHLKTYRTITPLEALQEYGCLRLAAVIHRLKQEGNEIITQLISRNNKSFAKYNLIQG